MHSQRESLRLSQRTWRSRRAWELGLSAIALLFCIQQQAIASTPNPSLSNIQLPLEEPELPSLGESSDFLPAVSEMRLVIKLSERRVHVYQGEQLKTSYPIAVGKPGWETPVGSYKVTQMIRDPYWEHPWTGEVIEPGPDNPLGARWIGFWTDGKNFIGFHGTPNEDSVGQPASHGCIRMLNKDILTLFATVDLGTPVIVEP